MDSKNKKRIIFISITAVVLICFGIVVSMIAGIASEASTLDTMLKKDVSDHVALDQVKKKISDMSFEVATNSSPTEIDATGPRHSSIIFHTWLQLKVTANQDGATNSFHFDRESSWF